MRARLRLAAAALLAPLLAACSPLTLLESGVPTDTYRLEAGVAYGAHPRQRLDVYLPREAKPGAPVLVFFYGGAWTSGERAMYRFVGEAFAARGIITVLPDYRLYPEVKFPDFVDDSAQAIRWVFDNAQRLGGDASQIYVGGHSAGAYNAAMIAFDPRYGKAAGFEPQRIAGFIGMAGPYDFLPLGGRLTRAIFGFPDTSPQTQPITFAANGGPRTLLLYATGDTIVAPHNSVNFAQRLQSAGVPARLIGYETLSHRTLVGSLARPLQWLAPTVDEIANFIR
jgi:acetyl esterase/lipase